MEQIQIIAEGVHFEVEKEILMQVPYFEALISRWSEHDVIQIEQSSKVFQEILYLLEEPYYCFPEEYVDELDYYGIAPPIQRLYENILSKTVKKLVRNESCDVVAPYIAERCLRLYKGDKYMFHSGDGLWKRNNDDLVFEIKTQLRKIIEYLPPNKNGLLRSYAHLNFMSFLKWK